MSPEEMIDRLVSGDDTGVDSQELWAAFTRDLAIEKLRPLLTSEHKLTRSYGAYLAYELGWQCYPLIGELTTLLTDPCPQNRSDAAVALTGCTTFKDGHALGRILLLLEDPDPFVQRAGMDFIKSCERRRLNVAINEAATIASDEIFKEFPRILGRPFTNYAKITKARVRHLVEHPHPVAQRFGAGLAVRPRLVIDDGLIELAGSSNDPGAKRVVEHAKKYSTPTHAFRTRLALASQTPAARK